MVNNQEGSFIKIRNEFIIGDEGYMRILSKDIRDKLLLVYIYLSNNVTRLEKVKFTLGDVIEESGYKQKSGAGKTNEQFKNTLVEMEERKIIKVLNNKDLNKITVNDFIICELQQVENNFFQLYNKEINIIINSNHSKSTQCNLIKVFSNIKARMYKRSSQENLYSGKYEVCFPSYNKMSHELMISEGKVKQYIDVLSEIDLIRYKSGESKIKDKIVQADNNTYTLYKENWEEELKGSIKYNKEKNIKSGWKYIKIKEDNRKIGGEKTQLLKKLRAGEITEKENNRLKEINKKLSKTTHA